MQVSKTFIGFLIIVVIIVGGVLIWNSTRGQTPAVTVPPVTTPAGNLPSSSSSTPTAAAPAAFDQTLSDGTIVIGYPSAQFGLATTPAQVLVQSIIPPCSENFNYCFYYNGASYQGTNFQSAGVRVDKRADLATQNTCLTTQPSGFTNLTPVKYSGPDYATSVFSSVGDAAAGSYSSGSLYRLWYPGAAAVAGSAGSSGIPAKQAACYEFETRIGQSQYGNYPPGSIQQFTPADQADLQAQLQNLITNITLPSGETPVFPPPAANNS